MPTLLVVGAGLFGSQAAAYARSRGIPALVFDPGTAGAASPAAGGLFKEQWAGKKLKPYFRPAVELLDRLYGIRSVDLHHADGRAESFLCVPPSAILEPNPIRLAVTSAGDGWLKAGGQLYEGWVYIAAGIWSDRFLPSLQVRGMAGTSLIFADERPGRIAEIAPGRQAMAFVRDPGTTFFSDGTAASEYSEVHEQQTLAQAAALGLTDEPLRRLHGFRPYTRGGPIFLRLGAHTWLATGGRKMGTIMGAAFARRLVEEELKSSDEHKAISDIPSWF